MLETASLHNTAQHGTSQHITSQRPATQRLLLKGQKMFKTSIESIAETEKLVAMLSGLSIGKMLTYKQASAAIGRNVQGAARPNLDRARRIVERETGARFTPMHNQGIVRLPTEEIPSIGSHARGRISKLAKRAYRRLSGMSANDVSPAVQTQILTERSHLGAIAMFSGRKTHKKIDAAITVVGSEIPAAQILAMFNKKSN